MAPGRQDELAACVTLEQGKTLPDAHGDVFRGLGAVLPLTCRQAVCEYAVRCCPELQAGKRPVSLAIPCM